MTELDEIRWAAVELRSPTAAGLFVYAVRTTGVFCVPVCPARRPRRENVEFFLTTDAAAAAGYRPCRRCRPDQERPTHPSVESVVAACRLIEELDHDLTVAELARRVGFSQRHFSRIFKETTGVTVARYRRARRAERVRTSLRDRSSVTDAVFDAGYGSMRAFYDHGARQLGGPPDSFRRGSAQTDVRYSTTATALGEVLVAATERGVCAVRLGDDPEELVAELRTDFPAASIEPDDDLLAPVATLVRDIAEGRPAAVDDIPLDLRGTTFQVRVWEELRLIDPGSTATYGEVAARLGEPTAARAVANACARNPAALLVPCHRVVPRTGPPGGYRWGTARKAALLAAERHLAGPPG